MKSYWRVICLAILTLPAVAFAAKPYGCDSINFGKEVLDKFPNAKAACLGVSQMDGGVYVHYQAKVIDIDKDLITVHMINHEGKALSKVKFVPAADQTAKVAGKDTKFSDLKEGTVLDLYIEHSKWGLYSSPNGKMMTIISREDP